MRCTKGNVLPVTGGRCSPQLLRSSVFVWMLSDHELIQPSAVRFSNACPGTESFAPSQLRDGCCGGELAGSLACSTSEGLGVHVESCSGAHPASWAPHCSSAVENLFPNVSKRLCTVLHFSFNSPLKMDGFGGRRDRND